MVTNLFKTAKPVDAAPKAKAGKKTDRARHELNGLERYTIGNALVKSLETVGATLKAELNVLAREIFLGSNKTTQPENFEGFEGKATASMQLRKRGENSPLAADDAELLKSHGLPVGTVEAMPQRFIMNPKYETDELMQKRVTKAFAVAGIAEDFFMVQEAVSKTVVTDETVSEMWRKGLAGELLDVVMVPAIRAKLDAPMPMSDMLAFAATLFASDKAKASEDLMASLKASVGGKKGK